MSSSDETTTGRYYPCGGADGCGHPVNDHARDGCALCPCEYAPEDWLRACEATNARLRERVAALEAALSVAGRESTERVPGYGADVRMCRLCDQVGVVRNLDHAPDCPFGALAQADETGGAR